MNNSPRIDTTTHFGFEFRNRRQSAADDGGQDLFAQALGQQLAKKHDDAATRYSAAKTKASAAARTDSTSNATAAADHPARDPHPTDDGATRSVSRETSAGKTTRSGTSTPGKAPSTGAKTSANSKTANPAPACKTTSHATPPAAEKPADGSDPAPVAADDAETTDTETGSDQNDDAAKDAVTAAAPATPAQPVAPVTPAATVAVVQPTVLLLSGVPTATDDTATAPGMDPEALAALLGKLPATQTATPKAPANAPPQQNDPNATGDGDPDPETIGQAEPSQSAPIDRATAVAAKPKTKAAGQNSALREPTDAIAKPALLQQAALTALAQTDAGTGRRVTLPEGMSVNEGGEVGVSDVEFSAWSEQLGPGFASGPRGANWQQSAFLAELKQNVQIMLPHEQVAIQIQRAAQNGLGRLTVDLQPAELGRVEIKMNVDKDKKVTASVVVDRPATLDLLQRDARNLERILQDAGLQTDSGSLSFSLRNSGGDAQGQNQGGGSGAGNRGETADSDAAATAAAAIRPTVVATADGYVDLET